MKKNTKSFLLVMLAIPIVAGCSGSASPSDDQTTVEAFEQPTTPVCVTDCDITPYAFTICGSIRSAFNGFQLQSIGSIVYLTNGRTLESATLFSYDSNEQAIIEIVSSSTEFQEEDAQIRSITTFTDAGLPDVVVSFTSGNVLSTTVYEYDQTNRLSATKTTIEFDGSEQRLKYVFNDAGQTTIQRAIEPVKQQETSRASYDYDSQGLLLSAEYVTSFTGLFEAVIFQHDSRDRLSGFNTLNSLFAGANESVVYLWDDNNNLVRIDEFDESGGLTRSRQLEYVEADSNVFNSVLFDLIFGPDLR